MKSTRQDITKGFIENMANEKYHSCPGISKSGLDKITRSPAHYKHSRPTAPTRAMEIGTAIHAAILEPERFDSEYFIADCSTRTAKAYKALKLEHGSELVLTKPESIKVLGMRESVECNYEAMVNLRKEGKAELSAICQDPETGVIIRARFDWLTECGVVVDVKKTQDIRPAKFAKSVSEYRYHVQDAMYSFIYKQITGEDLQEFYFLAIEENAPHSTALYRIDDLSREIGMHQFRRDLKIYADCLLDDKWPHPDTGEGVIELPNWCINAYEDELEVLI